MSNSIILSGPDAFYNQPEYEKQTRLDFAPSSVDRRSFATFNHEEKVSMARRILRIAHHCMPWKLLGSCGRYCAGKLIVPSSFSLIKRVLSVNEDELRGKISLDWHFSNGEKIVFKRINFMSSCKRVDAMIAGTPVSLKTKRWVLFSLPNFVSYEEYCEFGNTVMQVAESVKAGILFYNYPGVGSSEGHVNRKTLIKAFHQAMKVLEIDLGAKEIVAWGYSIGGGVQGEAMKTHLKKEDVRYVMLYDRTFSSLSSEIGGLSCACAGVASKALKWKLSPKGFSRRNSDPEIIVQSADKSGVIKPENIDQLIDDEVIKPKNSLARAVLSDNLPGKTVVGVAEHHNETLSLFSIELIIKALRESFDYSTEVTK